MKVKKFFQCYNKIILKLSFFLFCLILLTSCADTQPNIQPHLEGHTYGFLGGLWHGIIAPFSFIGSLFSDDIAIWAVNNNGGWYNFGFVLGIGALSGGTSSKIRK